MDADAEERYVLKNEAKARKKNRKSVCNRTDADRPPGTTSLGSSLTGVHADKTLSAAEQPAGAVFC